MSNVNAAQSFPNPSQWLKVDGGGGGQSTNKIAGPICHSVANLVLIQCKPWTNQQFQCRLQPLEGGTPVTTISQCQKRKCTVHQPIKQGPRKKKKLSKTAKHHISTGYVHLLSKWITSQRKWTEENWTPSQIYGSIQSPAP